MSEVDIQCIFNEWQNAIYSHFICYIKQNFDMPSSLDILTFHTIPSVIKRPNYLQIAPTVFLPFSLKKKIPKLVLVCM
jgi:hypothetical protein